MKRLLMTTMLAFSVIMICGCATHKETYTESTGSSTTITTTTPAATSTTTNTDQTQSYDVKSPQSGQVPSYQNPGVNNASKMISPVTQ